MSLNWRALSLVMTWLTSETWDFQFKTPVKYFYTNKMQIVQFCKMDRLSCNTATFPAVLREGKRLLFLWYITTGNTYWETTTAIPEPKWRALKRYTYMHDRRTACFAQSLRSIRAATRTRRCHTVHPAYPLFFLSAANKIKEQLIKHEVKTIC
jgi:hypothetical protein